VDVLCIYILEAHSAEEWQINKGFDDDVCYKQPKTLQERQKIAQDFLARYGFPHEKMMLDGMDNHLNLCYSAEPERLFVIDNGKVVYSGGNGPFNYDVFELRSFIEKRLKEKSKKKNN